MDDDVRKVLELICAKLPPYKNNGELEWEDVDLTERDFKRQGLSIDRGVSILKHKISGIYPVVEVGQIYEADPESSAREDDWGKPYVSMYAHPALADSLFRIEIEDASKTSFSFGNCVLKIDGKEISFGREDSKENGCYVLEHIFSHDLKDASFYRDIHTETVGEHESRYAGKRYYDACGVIQKRIAKEAGIGDFLVYNSSERGFVKINPKYLL
jgi:hypothetical protein